MQMGHLGFKPYFYYHV